MNKLKTAATYFSVGVTSMLLSASNVLATTINKDLTMDGAFSGIIGLIFTIAFWVGGIMTVFGVIMLIQSFVSDNPEQRTRYTVYIVSGIALIGVPELLKLAGIVS